uniref:C2 domain-containing protein n=1 Tax=Plectus sambesii TaxID=2011161 RepID=A0A914V9Q3_9BILA
MDLPNKIAGAVSSVKRVVTGKVATDPIDSYVQVSFAGQHGKTRVRKSSSTPVWNEQIVFVEMFPPLVRTIRVHVHDEADNLIATTFLDLSYLSDHSISGFMPTFGPAYINLYGTIRGVPGADPLNFGLGEGVAYRGRILLSLRVELEEHIPRKGVKNVHVKSCLPLPDKICGRKEQFFLFCAILSADTINKTLAGKPISFELSIGNDGSVTDGGTKPITSASGTSTADSDDLESINETVMTEGSCWHSRTQA